MAPDPLIGKTLGDYTIVGLLGRGGMSRIYRGYDENLQRYAAVKVISSDFATTPEEEYTRRFQSEARAIAHLRHPNIVGVYQFGRSEGIYYMAQVFLEGKDLRVVLKGYAARGARMPTAEVLRIAADIAGALDYAHSQGVIHRDIKPSNIMLERHTGRAILMDFGLALSVSEGTTGETFGSAHYIAPEQAVSSAQAVPQSDLYSLGVVLYEMLTGQVPFDDPSAMSVALKHLNDPPPPPRRYAPELPQAVEDVVLRVLDKDPTHRYHSGSALVEALTEAFITAAQPVVPAAGPSAELLNLIEAPAHAPIVRAPGDTTPPPMVGGPSEDFATRGLADRFARRKAQKDADAAALAAEADDLQIDERTLDSILDSYPDPRDLGTNPSAATGIPAPTDDTEPMQARSSGRRTRRALLAAIVVLLVVAGAVIWFNFLRDRTGNGDEGTISESLGTEPAETAAVVASATGEIATEDVATEDVTIEAASATEEAGAAMEAAAESTEPALAAAEEVTEEATEEDLAGSPTAVATGPDDVTAPAAGASRTPPPTSTPRAGMPQAATTSGAEPNVQLYYDDDSFLLVNVSDEPLDISDLVFERQRADGFQHSFNATEWSPYVSGSITALEAESCYQLLVADATRLPPTEARCPRLMGFFRSNVTRRYFWRSDDPDAAFTVREAEGETLATCPIAAGECALSLPQP